MIMMIMITANNMIVIIYTNYNTFNSSSTRYLPLRLAPARGGARARLRGRAPGSSL